MRRIVSEPVPAPHMIGRRPITSEATVISSGLAREVAPSMVARRSSSTLPRRPSAAARSRDWFKKSSMMTPVSAVSPASARNPAPTATLRS